MLRKIGGARNLQRWRAWYALEPRGDERADLQAALVALTMGGKEDSTLADFLEYLRDHWIPLEPEEIERRKKRRKKRWQARLARYGEKAQEAQETKRAHERKRKR